MNDFRGFSRGRKRIVEGLKPTIPAFDTKGPAIRPAQCFRSLASWVTLKPGDVFYGDRLAEKRQTSGV